MVSLMDRLLKLENLDLQLTPYRVLATGQDEGMVEFVPSTSLAQVRCVLLQYSHISSLVMNKEFLPVFLQQVQCRVGSSFGNDGSIYLRLLSTGSHPNFESSCRVCELIMWSLVCCRFWQSIRLLLVFSSNFMQTRMGLLASLLPA